MFIGVNITLIQLTKMRFIQLLVFVSFLLHFACGIEVPDEEFLQIKAQLRKLEGLETVLRLTNVSELEIRVEALEAGLALANDDISNLQDSQVVQDERFLAVEEDVTNLEDDMENLEDNLYAIEETTEQHEVQLTVLDGTTSLLDSRVTDLEATDALIQNNVTDLTTTDAVMQEDIDNLEDSVNHLEIHANATIGFNSLMAGDAAMCVDDILQFQNDLLNAGHRYDPETGKFAADQAGLYHFSVYLLSKDGRDMNNATNFHMVKNGAMICRVHLELDVDESELNLNDACAATVELLPGDEVYVTCGNVYVITSTINHNGFTGFLINPYLQ